VRYSSIGVGSFPHFDMELVARKSGVEMTHVPSKGGAGMVQDISTGDAHMGFVNVASSTPLVKSGRLRAFAVVNKERLPDFPDVPTLAELGYPDTATHHWLGIFARKGTPAHVLATVHKAANEATMRPETIEMLKKQSMTPFVKESPEAARAWLISELDRWEKTVSELKIKVD
jgi:tripartite-type tricarboxylate transporter receptor subunit TctC